MKTILTINQIQESIQNLDGIKKNIFEKKLKRFDDVETIEEKFICVFLHGEPNNNKIYCESFSKKFYIEKKENIFEFFNIDNYLFDEIKETLMVR